MENTNTKTLWGNRLFYVVFILLIIGSVGYTYYKIVIQKNYQIVAETSCNTSTEACFHYAGVVCDGSDSTCVPEEAYDYKMVSKTAANIYACEQTEEKIGCSEELSCNDGESDCSYTFCDKTIDTNCSEVSIPIVKPVIGDIATSTQI